MQAAAQDNLSALLGMRFVEPADADAKAELEVTDRVRQPHGLVHGGVYCVLAETLASKATNDAVSEDGNVAMGQSNQATFLRPISSGRVIATANAIHRGRTSWVWDVACADRQGRLAAVVRVTVAVRPRDPSASEAAGDR